jgi:hypothetical protein
MIWGCFRLDRVMKILVTAAAIHQHNETHTQRVPNFDKLIYIFYYTIISRYFGLGRIRAFKGLFCGHVTWWSKMDTPSLPSLLLFPFYFRLSFNHLPVKRPISFKAVVSKIALLA